MLVPAHDEAAPDEAVVLVLQKRSVAASEVLLDYDLEIANRRPLGDALDVANSVPDGDCVVVFEGGLRLDQRDVPALAPVVRPAELVDVDLVVHQPLKLL